MTRESQVPDGSYLVEVDEATPLQQQAPTGPYLNMTLEEAPTILFVAHLW